MRLALLLLLVGLAAPASAQTVADTIFVTTAADVVDFGGAQQVADLPGPDGLVTLREAVFAANNTPGPQVIGFRIPLTDFGYWTLDGFFRLFLNTFPNTLYLTDDGTTIDGTTQTAFTGDTNPFGPEIVIFQSTVASTYPGIIVHSNDNVFRGIDGPRLASSSYDVRGDRNRFEGCFFRGLNNNLKISGADNVVGGTTPEARNWLSGGLTVLLITGPNATGNVIQGNRITSGNQQGIWVTDGASGNLIGGFEPGAGNVLAAIGRTDGEGNPQGTAVILGGNHNTFAGNSVGIVEDGTAAPGLARRGISTSGTGNRVVGNVVGGFSTYRSETRYALSIGGTGTVVQGNVIGLDPASQEPRPNTVGIFVSGTATGIQIGGTEPGEGNVVAHSEAYGIGINGPSARAAVLGNVTFGSGTIGIDLGVLGLSNGPTPNDPGDADEGPNRLQNTPVLSTATMSGETLVVHYAVDTAPAHATYPLRVEFFRAVGADGVQFLGAATYTEADYQAGMPGTAQATLDVTGLGLSAGDAVTATATDAAGHTSEFTATSVVVADGGVVAQEGDAPEAWRLGAVTPNPARGSAHVALSLPQAGTVTVEVLDALGRRVLVVHDGPLGAGTHALALDTQALPAGVYLLRAEASGTQATRRLVVAR